MWTLLAGSAPRLAAVPRIQIGGTVDVSLTWRVDVPRARVWQCLTEAHLLSQWLGELVSGAVGAGSEGVTVLGLGHSGLDDLAESYRDGWCVHLTYLEAAALGTPLPRSMFWRLHGTVAQLNAR